LVELVKKRIEKNDLAVYAISHRKEILKQVTGSIIELEKEGGITRRINN